LPHPQDVDSGHLQLDYQQPHEMFRHILPILQGLSLLILQ